jgi:IS5 family transposase
VDRRSFLAIASLSIVAAPAAQTAQAATRLDAATMKAALQTATPEEEGFLSRVEDLVNRGVLSVELVDSTLQWARKKSKYRFQYFKRALILRAAKEGITVA